MGFVNQFKIGGHNLAEMEVSYGWSRMENPNLKLMIWGYPYFRKPPKSQVESRATQKNQDKG